MRNWSKSQLQFLNDNYATLSAREISLATGKTEPAIRCAAFSLKINCINYKKWEPEDLDLLKIHYPNKTKIELQKIFKDRIFENIKSKANDLGLKRLQKNKELIKGNCEKLLLETPESFYWMGFLLADGHFSKDNRLVCALAVADKNHLIKLAAFLNAKTHLTKKPSIRLQIMDVYNVLKIKNKFDINNIKTYNPPDFTKYKYSNELLISLIIGFIDGDGSIRKYKTNKCCGVAIKCYSTWLKFFFWIKNVFKLYFDIESGFPKINNRGYSYYYSANQTLLRKLKQFGIDYRLPVLERKWSKITL